MSVNSKSQQQMITALNLHLFFLMSRHMMAFIVPHHKAGAQAQVAIL